MPRPFSEKTQFFRKHEHDRVFAIVKSATNLLTCWLSTADECKCRDGEHRCIGSDKCVEARQFCDGQNDCPNNDDEVDCRKYNKLFSLGPVFIKHLRENWS